MSSAWPRTAPGAPALADRPGPARRRDHCRCRPRRAGGRSPWPVPSRARPHRARSGPPIPVWPVLLDLPLLRGDEAPHAPHLAVTATPWPGAAAVWVSARSRSGPTWAELDDAQPSVMGQTLTPLTRARPGVWDRGPALRVRVKGGTLEGATSEALMAGGDLLAVGDGSAEGWEVAAICRGAADLARIVGTVDAVGRGRRARICPDAGCLAGGQHRRVLLDGAAQQVELAPTARNQLRYWRAWVRRHGRRTMPVIARSRRRSGASGCGPCRPVTSRWKAVPSAGSAGRGFRAMVGTDQTCRWARRRSFYLIRLVRDGNVLAQAQGWRRIGPCRKISGLPPWRGAHLPSRWPSFPTLSDRDPMQGG